MYNFENIIKGKADIKRIWEFYSDVTKWPDWDCQINKVDMKGDFEVGAKGSMFMDNMPPLPFVLDEIEENKKFIDTSVFGDISVTFGHFITEEADGEVSIKHTVSITGPNEGQIQGMGKGITKDIPENMLRLLKLSTPNKP